MKAMRCSSNILKIYRFSSVNNLISNTYSTNLSKEKFTKKRERFDLAELVTSTHMTLRYLFLNKEDEEVQLLWLKHKENIKLLQEYSNSVHTLATKHWGEHTENGYRIKWTYDALKKYFYGGLQAEKLEKETKRVAHHDPTSLKDFKHNARAILKRYEEIKKLRILDVGSCYNPFGKFEDLEITPIDLQPVIPEVHRCDFLDLKVIEGEDKLEDTSSSAEKRPENEKKSSMIEFNGSSEKYFEDNIVLYGTNSEKISVGKDGDYVSELKAASYDAVIFSYFLDYIPTAKLRYECCLKAYKLLKPSGILCIAIPNQRKPDYFYYVMWKFTLATFGFERIKYEECSHFDGMMFRKNLSPSTVLEDEEKALESIKSMKFFSKLPDMKWHTLRNSLYLVQDLKEIEYSQYREVETAKSEE